MYNRTNPAVIKMKLFNMTKDELKKEIEFIKTEAIRLEYGTKRTMFIKLYRFAISLNPKA